MDTNDKDTVIPIIREEIHAEAVPVVTGGVRVTKRVESHDEMVEQELLKSTVDVDRVPVDQIVDGPQPVRRVGNTTIIPVVSEVLRVEKQFVVTEEIHLTENQQQQTVQTNVTLYNEQPQIERLDREGNVVPSPVVSNKADDTTLNAKKVVPITENRLNLTSEPASILKRNRENTAAKQSKLSSLPATPSILTKRPRK